MRFISGIKTICIRLSFQLIQVNSLFVGNLNIECEELMKKKVLNYTNQKIALKLRKVLIRLRKLNEKQ
jgi:hypothetical protein